MALQKKKKQTDGNEWAYHYHRHCVNGAKLLIVLFLLKGMLVAMSVLKMYPTLPLMQQDMDMSNATDPSGALFRNASSKSSLPKPAQKRAFIDANIILAGVAKDVKPGNIHSVISKLRMLGEQFNRYHIVVYENNSNGRSRKALNDAFEYNRGNTKADTTSDYTLVSEDLQRVGGSRTKKIADARNKLLDIIAKINVQNNQTYEYLVITDMDGACGYNMSDTYSPSVLREAITGRHKGNWDVLSFDCNPYWDRWAFRHKEVMPYNMYGRRSGENKIQTPKDMDNWVKSLDSNKLEEVQSAFMMLTLYRLGAIKGARYGSVDEDGSMDCEHVPFHKAMASGGARIRLWPVSYCEPPDEYRLIDDTLRNRTQSCLYARHPNHAKWGTC